MLTLRSAGISMFLSLLRSHHSNPSLIWLLSVAPDEETTRIGSVAMIKTELLRYNVSSTTQSILNDFTRRVAHNQPNQYDWTGGHGSKIEVRDGVEVVDPADVGWIRWTMDKHELFEMSISNVGLDCDYFTEAAVSKWVCAS